MKRTSLKVKSSCLYSPEPKVRVGGQRYLRFNNEVLQKNIRGPFLQPPNWSEGRTWAVKFALFVLQGSRIHASSHSSSLSVLEGWENDTSQIDLRCRKWCRKFVLNLCFLCFQVPEFVLLSFTCYSRNKFGGLRKCYPKLNYESGMVSKIFA